ncbi:hypothetical protein [Parasegetibacter sp. NRK P23]|uniref:hypothetical protein n=1 Tax=Parasegetibacter sp. NRK P23 TaxID=2942999 RepID=UPI00204434AD|nr:hypothetical protein [Parasegetibacter sp. NRK P23]MCM5528647.1 hypothetical protein [Parasegetibacter sp. NRK P23]
MRQLFLLPLLLLPFAGFAQEEESKSGRLSPKEFAIPPSPVFDLMGVTPSQINRTSDIKDFKVDWSFKSWRLNPNIAIQSQPVWELLYRRKDLKKYQRSDYFMRRLASLDVSLGTVQNEESDRRIGFAGKMNILKGRDPLMEKDLYEEISIRFQEEQTTLEAQLKALQEKLDTSISIIERSAIRTEISNTNAELQTLNSRRNTEINERAALFVAEHWNAASLDVAFGRVYTYQSDSAGSLNKLRLNRNTGWGMWVNGGVPLGKRWLLSGLIRTTWYEEELNFLLRDKNTGEETQQLAVAENKLYSAGINLRYGGPLYSFFVEFLYEKKALKTPIEALSEAFTAPADVEIVESSVKWTTVHPNALSLGGDWRISRNVIINYGMRWILDKNGKSQAFIPVAGISCMMR